MRRFVKNAMAVGFLLLFLPYTITLLLNGKQGIHQEEMLSDLEYEVLSCMMKEDYSWMEDGTLDLMAMLHRTACVLGERTEEESHPAKIYDENYRRMYEAVLRTQGQAVAIAGEYRDLPYHEISAGETRDGRLLGEEYTYVRSVDCSGDRESDRYLWYCMLTEEELAEALGGSCDPDGLEYYRDACGYVTRVEGPGTEWTGEAFRSLLHLPSSCFWMDRTEDGIKVTVKGVGHGFGISLYTADRMIRDGADVLEIIQKFYEGAECITIP